MRKEIPDSVNSWTVRIPISTLKDLKWIKDNLKEESSMSYSRITERSIKKMRREAERKHI